ncbi:putative RNA-directed DNA polymerase [Tanacetum coccineum]
MGLQTPIRLQMMAMKEERGKLGATAIGVKWVFKTKLEKDGKIDKHKARLMVKGYAQKKGLDYSEVFAPVTKWDTIRSIFALAAQRGMKVHQLDIKSAFLYGELEETVFVEQPQGYVVQGNEGKVYQLRTALYGLKQSPRACVRSPMVPGCKLVKDDLSGFVDATMYKQMVGCIMYLAATRPDIMYVAGQLCRYMETPTKQHMAAMKRYVCFLSGAAIAWSSKQQPIVTLSTTEAEFVAATTCACQVLWLRRMLEYIGLTQEEGTIVNCDNMSTIKLSKNSVMHNRSKHIDVRYYFLRDLVNDGAIELRYCNTLAQVADIMTKPLKVDQFEKLRDMMGMVKATEGECNIGEEREWTGVVYRHTCTGVAAFGKQGSAISMIPRDLSLILIDFHYGSQIVIRSRMSNTSDKGTTFGDGAARVGMQLRSSPKVSTSSPLVSPYYFNGPENVYRMEILEALGSICIQLSDPIVQSVDINKSTSYVGVAGGSAKDQPNVNSNFRTLVADPVFDGVNISIPRKVVEKAKHGLKRIMMNSKGFFFFKFDSRAGLEAVLEGGPWLIRKSPIILKKWSMDTRLLKEELTRIPIWVKLHDVPIQVFKRMVNSEADLVDVVTIGISYLSEDDFTKETICVEYE